MSGLTGPLAGVRVIELGRTRTLSPANYSLTSLSISIASTRTP
jgi:hypothetical protein